jgi:hypothetical protein
MHGVEKGEVVALSVGWIIRYITLRVMDCKDILQGGQEVPITDLWRIW